MSSPWPTAPQDLTIHERSVGVFLLNLDLPDSRLAELAGLLDEKERARAERMVIPTVSRRFTAAHGFTRQVLGAVLTENPPGLRFEQTEYGKPYLVDGSRMQFNLSHSGGLGLLACALDQPVGVDVEVHRPELDRSAIAQRFFSTLECEELLGFAPEEQATAFYRCWTRKEAYMKGRGLGLKIPLDAFSVSLAPTQPRLVQADPLAPPGETWTFYALDPLSGYTSSLAVAGAPVEVSCWSWPGA